MLSKRQIIVLKAIIDAYSQSEEPIGSKSILKLTGLEASSATIRNDMAKLEKLDLIKKMHSSSGRVPTEAG
ncbi:DeoR family transcriptional regulator, partial [Corynebacterium sp. UMB6689]|nr:DeoR family transcriptional regulator [Corynebacterium sp. UMB6689]